MKVANIRNVESHGMICAEDEVGLGNSHAGILVLPDDLKVGTDLDKYYDPYEDWVFEIGLTPNRMDAMSHWGVARDVCAYVNYHQNKQVSPRLPSDSELTIDNTNLTMSVNVENPTACPRYSGVSISNIKIGASPKWLQQKLKAIGVRSINNIVDITNFIQHETGQPLHAFDADAITSKKVKVKNLPAGTSFVTLDDKERKLFAEDLMICNDNEPMCIAGVYGGLHSGVTETTKNIFLESACFEAVSIRKTSSRHGLKTDAASRFEKGTDVSATVRVLKRAAVLIKEICGGEIASGIVDEYPGKREKTKVILKYSYLKKLSGKDYAVDAAKKILTSLGFEILDDHQTAMTVAAPFHKPDISLPADIVEEIMRMDGFDNIHIPAMITITPSPAEHYATETMVEKVAACLVGLGFHEIMTNSITNSAYFPEDERRNAVPLINNLSVDLNMLRPSMLETGLESIAYNLNRKNTDLRFFEFGRTYSKSGPGAYHEAEHLCLYISGNSQEDSWRSKGKPADFHLLKGFVGAVFQLLGIQPDASGPIDDHGINEGAVFSVGGQNLVKFGMVNRKLMEQFSIKQAVYFADFNWDVIAEKAVLSNQSFQSIPRFPAVQRDLAIVVPQQLPFEKVEQSVQKIKLNKLQTIKLFDIFESEKLGAGKKSMAMNFVFLDGEKTLTDKEIEGWMKTIIDTLEKDLQAEIRK